MERIILLHSRLQLTIAATLVVMIVWGLIGALRREIGPGYRGMLWVTQLLIIAEALLGLPILVQFSGFGFGRMVMHMVYAGLALTGLPLTLYYNRGRTARRQALIFAGICFLLLGVVIRAYQTAS